MKRAHIYVEGRVQGVGFRANTRRTANRLGLTGWVRNLRDGRVEIIAEGDDNMIDRLIQWCHRGTTMAHVTNVTVEKEDPTGEFNLFRTRSTV